MKARLFMTGVFEEIPRRPPYLVRVTFGEFWPRYLGAHRDPRTRWCHVAGTLAATSLVAAAIALRKPWLAAAALGAGYGPAWFSHAMFEHNKPETFRAPFASLAADYLMAYHVLRGSINDELMQL